MGSGPDDRIRKLTAVLVILCVIQVAGICGWFTVLSPLVGVVKADPGNGNGGGGDHGGSDHGDSGGGGGSSDHGSSDHGDSGGGGGGSDHGSSDHGDSGGGGGGSDHGGSDHGGGNSGGGNSGGSSDHGGGGSSSSDHGNSGGSSDHGGGGSSSSDHGNSGNSNAGGNSDRGNSGNSNAGGNSDRGNSGNSNAGGNSDRGNSGNSNAGGNSDRGNSGNSNAADNSANSNAGGNSANSNAADNSANSNAGGNSGNSNAGGNAGATGIASTINVAGTADATGIAGTIVEKGDGQQSIDIDLDAAKSAGEKVSVEETSVRIELPTYTISVTTKETPKEEQGKVTAEIESISLQGAPVTAEFAGKGTVTASFGADLKSLPGEGATVAATLIEQPDAQTRDAYDRAALEKGYAIESVAYAMKVDKPGLEDVRDIGTATVTMSVSPVWVLANGGFSGIHIARLGDDGTSQILETRFDGIDTDGNMVFTGTSPGGLSIFALISVKGPAETVAAQPNSSATSTTERSTAPVFNPLSLLFSVFSPVQEGLHHLFSG